MSMYKIDKTVKDVLTPSHTSVGPTEKAKQSPINPNPKLSFPSATWLVSDNSYYCFRSKKPLHSSGMASSAGDVKKKIKKKKERDRNNCYTNDHYRNFTFSFPHLKQYTLHLLPPTLLFNQVRLQWGLYCSWAWNLRILL